MNQTGYFQAVWLFIWNIIKNSAVYKILRKVYDGISGSWKRSRITNFFRTEHLTEGAATQSLSGRMLHAPFTFFAFLQRTVGERLTALLENSGFIYLCNVFLHNLLALNLRFLGVAVVGVGIGNLAVGFFHGAALNIMSLLLVPAGIVLTLFNVNLTSYLKHSLVVRLVENCLGTTFSFDFYYCGKTKAKGRLIVAAISGLLCGCVSMLISPILGVPMLFGIAFVFAVFYKVEIGIFAALFAAPLIPTMALVGLILLCLGSLLIRGITNPNFKWKFDGIGFLMIGMLIIYFLAAVTSFVPLKSMQIWLIYFAFMSVYFLIINTVKTKKQLIDLLMVFVLSGLLVCLYGIAQYVFGWDTAAAWIDEEMFTDIKMRIYSTLGNPNVLGEYILLVLPVSVGLLWIKKKPLQKLVYLAITGILFLALILTFSRGCWIGIMIAAAIFITFVAGKLWGLGLIALPILPAVLPESITNRFLSIGDLQDSSTSYRVYIWMGTLAMMKDFWKSGIGMGSEAFAEVYPFYSYHSIVAPHSHNLFLQIAVESGVVGILVFLLILAWALKKMTTGYGYVGKGHPIATMMVAIGAGICGFLVQGMFDNCFYNYRVFMIFWAVLALGIACAHVAKDIFEREKEAKAQ